MNLNIRYMSGSISDIHNVKSCSTSTEMGKFQKKSILDTDKIFWIIYIIDTATDIFRNFIIDTDTDTGI